MNQHEKAREIVRMHIYNGFEPADGIASAPDEYRAYQDIAAALQAAAEAARAEERAKWEKGEREATEQDAAAIRGKG